MQSIEQKSTSREEPSAVWESISESLQSAFSAVGLSRAAIGAGVLVAAAALSGCSPQTNSYWTGSYTELPPPPPAARMQIGVSTEEDGTVFINYVMWNKDDGVFERKDIHYSTTMTNVSGFSEMGGYKQKIHDGEVLSAGVIVDQTNQVIILPNGNRIEGKTGNIVAPDGKVVKEFAGQK